MVNKMIAVYAEKFDVGLKIAAACGGFDFNGTHISMANVEKYKEQLSKTIKKNGVIPIVYEGQEYEITWGQGHMCGLKQAYDYVDAYKNWSAMPLPFFPESYEIKIREGVDRATKKKTGEADPWTVRQLQIVGDIFNRSKYIINATDDDREGETIFAYVYEILQCDKPYQRMIMNSQTEDGLQAAIHALKPSESVKNIEQAGRARGIADLMVGGNLTAAMSLKYGNGKVLSIGRVQTIVLKWLVDRETAIQNFVSHPFWYVEGTFYTQDGGKYIGKHAIAQIEDKNEADALFQKVNGKDGVIDSYEKEPFKKPVPFLYSQTTLAKMASRKYGFTAQETLDIAQELYNAGYTTYPRVDSQHLTEDMKPTIDGVLDMLSAYSEEYRSYIDMVPAGQRNYTKRHFNNAKVTSHYAIIPTNITPKNLTDKQKKLYDLIARSVIRIIFQDAKGEKTKIITNVDGEEFKTTGTVITDEQWMVVDGISDTEDLLPHVEKGESVAGEYEMKEGKTSPPKRYDDDMLITAMCTAGKEIEEEELKQILADAGDGGIGTPATRGGIIETLMLRNYAKREGKSIVPTEIGKKLIEIFPVEDLKSSRITAEWELRLKHIEEGKDTLDSFILDMEQSVVRWIQEIKDAPQAEIVKDENTLPYSCPKCGKPLRKYSWGWACSGYKKNEADSCKFALSYQIAGVNLTDKDLEMLLTKKKTRYIKGFKKKDSEDTYDAFLILDDEGKLGRTWDVGINCPLCGKPITIGKKAWGCSGWKDGCKVTVWNEICGKKLTDAEKTDLLVKGKTKVIKGFVSKAGKTFDTALILDETGKVTFPPRE